MPMATDMPASRLFDTVFTCWLTQFEHWKTSTQAPEMLYQQAFSSSNQVVSTTRNASTGSWAVRFRRRSMPPCMRWSP